MLLVALTRPQVSASAHSARRAGFDLHLIKPVAFSFKASCCSRRRGIDLLSSRRARLSRRRVIEDAVPGTCEHHQSPHSAPRIRTGQATSALRYSLATFLAYATLFVYRTSFLVGGVRYFSLFDDGMISMRYARNLAHGFGLVWNPGGARVEGFTNPLWVFYMAAWHLLPVADAKISLAIQVTAISLLTANLVVVRHIALRVSGESEAAALGAIALTGFYLPLNNWSLQGMEVSVLVLTVSAAVLLCLRCLEDGATSAWMYLDAWQWSTWVPSGHGGHALAGIVLFMAGADRPHRRRHLLWGATALVVGVASQTWRTPAVVARYAAAEHLFT